MESRNGGIGNNGNVAGIGKHRFSMEQRRECKITGVVEVQSFDENNILMETVDGMLAIKGTNLHVGRLNLEKGEADVDGKVDSLAYFDKNTLAKKGEGLLTRLFG
ncbi:MAG: sporulation protein YabP [Lachnospiraceae bacterium]|nr:sporulation protein YabP [Lachnospiraceae bacterium]MDE7274602.1 sporulation protein YabP [Lachnospiraceae bacterium]